MSNLEASDDAPEENAPEENVPEEGAAKDGGETLEAGDESESASASDEALDAAPDEDAEVVPEELPPLVPVLEAALFAAAEAMPIARLTRVLGAWTKGQIATALGELAERKQREGSGLRLVETAGGFQLRSASEFAPWVRKFFAEKPPRLSRAVLETLAVIAYRQPVTRGEVEAVRGVNCDAVLGALAARGLITQVGRRQSPGRPTEYGTTSEFLELFSLRELSDLPPLPDPGALASLVEAASEEGDAESESSEFDGASDGALAEDPESGGDRLEESSGGADPGGSGPGEREGDPRAGGEG
ncbi:MAG: SMC-Scp complex subunit ScpB [Deltaproteobacteria bacterium]|nr:SMC-Scp complex subunit ScpB [Deltaproteobacteria bacterium]